MFACCVHSQNQLRTNRVVSQSLHPLSIMLTADLAKQVFQLLLIDDFSCYWVPTSKGTDTISDRIIALIHIFSLTQPHIEFRLCSLFPHLENKIKMLSVVPPAQRCSDCRHNTSSLILNMRYVMHPHTQSKQNSI